MAGDVRGHDLESWWQNRGRYRADVSDDARQWRTEAARLSSGSGGAKAGALAAPPDETIQSAMRSGDSLLMALTAARNQLQGLEGERQQAQSDFASEQSAIESGSRQRIQAERAQAHKNAQESAVRAEKSKVIVRKISATLIFLVVLYVIVQY
jgi:Fe2+ transport system protein B